MRATISAVLALLWLAPAQATQLYTSDNGSTGFDATTAGSLPGGWANGIGTWQASTTDPLSAHAHTLLDQSVGAQDAAIYTGATATADMEVTFATTVTAVTTVPTAGAPILRASAGYANAYIVVFIDTTHIQAYKKISGVYTALGSPASIGFTVGNGNVLVWRAQVQGTALQAKVWPKTSAEPTSWAVSITDSSISAAGYGGLYEDYGAASGASTGSDFSITSLQSGEALITLAPTQIVQSGGLIVVSGTYTGTAPTALDYSVDGGSYSAASSPTIGGGTFSFSIANPANGIHTIDVRDHNATSVSDSGLYIVSGAATFTLSPGTCQTGTSGNSIALAGSGSSWTTGTPGSPTFSASAGTIAGQTVGSATSATLTFTCQSSGTATITDPSSGYSQTIASYSSIATNDSNLFFSPYNWYVNGASQAQSNDAGAYLKVGFTGTSIGLNVNVANLTGAGVTSTQYPFVRWSVDGGPYTTQQLTSASGLIPLASGLTAGTHSLTLYLVSLSISYDRWNMPVQALYITSLRLDGGAASAAPSLLSKRCILFGDSITEGEKSTGGSTFDPVNSDAQLDYAAFVSAALGCEFGQIGFGGQGWGQGGVGSVPAFPTTWSAYFSGKSRLVSGLLSPAPDYAFVNMGTNDTTNIASTAATWLASFRAASGAGAKLFLLIPFAGTELTNLTTGFNAYQAATPDANAHLVNLGVSGSFDCVGLTPSYAAVDGCHPNYRMHGQLGAMLAQAVQPPSGSAAGTVVGLLMLPW